MFSLKNHVVLTKYRLGGKLQTAVPLTRIKTHTRVIAANSYVEGLFSSAGALELYLKNKVVLYSTESIVSQLGVKSIPKTAITTRVRGIAKNPVDHPNGGRANTKGSFKTP